MTTTKEMLAWLRREPGQDVGIEAPAEGWFEAAARRLAVLEEEVGMLKKMVGFDTQGNIGNRCVVIDCRNCGTRHEVCRDDFFAGKYDIPAALDAAGGA